MKEELLKYIKCPVCAKNTFEINGQSNNNIFSEGDLYCKECGNKFKISKGILYLYDKLSPESEIEKKSHENEVDDNLNYQDNEWLLKFPQVERIGTDRRSERIIRLISKNTVLSLDKYIKGENLKILEIGASNCWATARLAGSNYCIALDIITIPPIGLEAGQAFIDNNIFFERVSADMISLPFLGKVFDCVFISSSLHHSPDINKTLQEIKRVIKNQGQLVLLNEPSSGVIGSTERKRVEKDASDGFNEKRYTIFKWKKIFKQNDFNYQIFLPENIINVFSNKSGIVRIAGMIFKNKFILKIINNYFTVLIYVFFDGFFNAVLSPKSILNKKS